ncbi:MAG: DUF1257 domain-containing protein [Candidatus Omnitrophica bacterium]|jgi:hypothetical protein|nr:DUF1257 domain-containing protein [Candidatus Omnitrophota bacterium]
MSHKSEVKLELNNKEYLLKSLTSLGFSYLEAEEGKTLRTKGNYSVHEEVDILITDNNSCVGFKQQSDGTYKAIGDFYGLHKNGKSYNTEIMSQEVTSHAKEAEVIERLAALSFSLEEGTRTENNNEICFELTRYVG